VTIPTPQLNQQFGSTVVLANTSRAFPLQPAFGCVNQPTLVTTEATLVDQRGARSTLTVTTVVR
jgi:hypothetical protein